MRAEKGSARASALRELAWLFLKLGTVAFGGPAVHIAMFEDEVVHRRGWMSRERFLDLLGATNLIPGPNSTEMTIHVGYVRAGWPGLVVAGSCFILPAAIMVTGIAALYARYGTLPAGMALLYGVKPVVIAVILQALWRLGRTAVTTRTLAVVGAGGVVLNLLGVNELAILFGAGLLTTVARRLATRDGGGPVPIVAALASGTAAPVAQAAAASFGLWPLFLSFVKIGSILFGSGYVLLAFLRADLVERWHWITEAQLLDATAVGQVTPGPLFTTATFIGYVLAGPTGACVATLGIFLPAFVFVAASSPLIPRLRASADAGAFLDGVTVGSLALMTVVTLQLGRSALVDLPTWSIGIASAVLLLRFRLNTAWLVLGGATVGLLATVL